MPRQQEQPSEVSIRLHVKSEANQSDSLEAELVVDGAALPAFDNGPLDLVALECSTRGDGAYFIWTCWCGEPGCAGNFEGVEVRHMDDVVHWDDRDIKRQFTFRREDVMRALTAAVDEARRLLLASPGLTWAPEANTRITDLP